MSIIILFILALAMTFDPVAEFVSKMIGVEKDVLQEQAKAVMPIIAGLAFMWVAVSFAAMPFVGVGFALVGATILVLTIAPVIRANLTD